MCYTPRSILENIEGFVKFYDENPSRFDSDRSHIKSLIENYLFDLSGKPFNMKDSEKERVLISKMYGLYQRASQ